MADNLLLNAGTGTESLVTEETAAHKHVPSGRVGWGARGSYTEVTDEVAEGLPIQAIDGEIQTLGAKGDAAAALDTSTASLISLTKRELQKLTTMSGQMGVGGLCYRANMRPYFGTASAIAITTTTPTQILAAAGAAYYHVVNTIILTNTSDTAEIVTVREGNGGTIKAVLYVPAKTTLSVPLGAPILFAANTAVYMVCTNGVTTLYAHAYGSLAT